MNKQEICVAISGEARHGKDYFASQVGGSKIVSIAEPLYWLCRRLVGTDDKSVPGVRRMLIDLGEWGRGSVSEESPLSCVRAMFTKWIREEARKWAFQDNVDFGVDFSRFGTDENIWLNAACNRCRKYFQEGYIPCIVNARFPNELDFFSKDPAFLRVHVYTTPLTMAQRLDEMGEKPVHAGSLSEKYARDINHKIQNFGPHAVDKNIMLVWTDDRVEKPDDSRWWSIKNANAFIHDYYHGIVSKDDIWL